MAFAGQAKAHPKQGLACAMDFKGWKIRFTDITPPDNQTA